MMREAVKHIRNKSYTNIFVIIIYKQDICQFILTQKFLQPSQVSFGSQIFSEYILYVRDSTGCSGEHNRMDLVEE